MTLIVPIRSHCFSHCQQATTFRILERRKMCMWCHAFKATIIRLSVSIIRHHWLLSFII